MKLTEALTRISYELRAARIEHREKVRVFIPLNDYRRLEYELIRDQRVPQRDQGFRPCVEICGNILVQPIVQLEELEHFYKDAMEREHFHYTRGYNDALAEMHEKVKDA